MQRNRKERAKALAVDKDAEHDLMREALVLAAAMVVMAALALLPSTVDAGTVLAKPAGSKSKEAAAQAADEDGDEPKSFFGRVAFDGGEPELGVDEHYAAKATRWDDEKQYDDEGSAPGRGGVHGRSPASVMPGVKTGHSASSHPNGLHPNLALPMASRGVQEVALIVNELGFFPKTVFVTRDVPVRLYVTGAAKGTMCLMMDSFQVSRQVRPQKVEEVVFTAREPGQYRYYCPINGMEGTLVVRDLAADKPSAKHAQKK